MTATPIDLAITLLLLFVLFAACAAGVLALPWSDEELEASARAARSIRSLPKLVRSSLARTLQRSAVVAPMAPLASSAAPEAA